ncbi:GNAT family N-acetyltransferase [Streptomyces sp. KR80]|uniref:GNAT family N-acetyltransferase n=1 Tax=Streptomyces sp. KR80 TaxID=3457426 RepID=UPI003FD048D1
MTERRGTAPHFRIAPLSATHRRATGIAALTRAAYRDSDPLPGLPVPDGARETEAAVLADLRRGATVWLAEDATGEPVGALRVTEQRDGAWAVARVSVVPAVRGSGVARALLDAVDAAAAEHGVPVIRLDAVVERCLPSLYARLGFRAIRHWPSGDKPLTEVTMERRPGAPVLPHPLPWVPPAGGPGVLLVVWLLTVTDLVAVVEYGEGDGTRPPFPDTAVPPGARLAGIDVWRDAQPYEREALVRRFAALGRRTGDGTVCFPPDRGGLRAHVMPRTVDPRLHARYRPVPGAEPPLDGIDRSAALPVTPPPAPSLVPTAAVRWT